jgi:hypothetical protein
MLTAGVVEKYRIVQNDARVAGQHTAVGRTRSGNEVLIQKDFLACTFKILTRVHRAPLLRRLFRAEARR